MKKSIFSFVALLVAFVLAYAFKPAPATLFTSSFQLSSPTADPFEPNSYVTLTITPATDCPGESKVCAIIVPASDVYSSGPKIGKPKVDDFSASGLGTEISVALDVSNNDPTQQNGRQIFEKN